MTEYVKVNFFDSFQDNSPRKLRPDGIVILIHCTVKKDKNRTSVEFICTEKENEKVIWFVGYTLAVSSMNCARSL